MALGGGIFSSQNKVLPGAYINFVSKARAMGGMGERGVVASLLKLNWGKENEIFTVESGDFQKESRKLFGYDYTAAELLYLREVFCGAKSVKLYRPGGNKKASAKTGALTVTALYGGTRGNDIKITVENDIDDNELYTVKTLLDGVTVDTQTVKDYSELTANDFITFNGTGIPDELTAGTSLTGGADTDITGSVHSDFLEKAEAEDFTVLLYDGSDDTTKSLYTAYAKRLRNDEGVKFTLVLHDYAKAGFEGVISVKNTVSGVNPQALIFWVAGMSAGCNVNESLTNRTYNGELTVNAIYKKSEFIKFTENGEFAFYTEKGTVKVLKDINSFTNFEPYKNSDFGSNQVIRILDQIAADTADIFNNFYLGKAQNNETGRNLFKAELVNYHEKLQKMEAITNFSANDIQVLKGAEKGDVIVEEAVEPVGSMEKIFMTVSVV